MLQTGQMDGRSGGQTDKARGRLYSSTDICANLNIHLSARDLSPLSLHRTTDAGLVTYDVRETIFKHNRFNALGLIFKPSCCCFLLHLLLAFLFQSRARESIACYVWWLVRPSTHPFIGWLTPLFFAFTVFFFASHPLPKCLANWFYDIPCPTARNLGSRVSGLV